MIIGDYYVNDLLLLGVVLATLGGAGYIAGVPGMLTDSGTTTDQSEAYKINLEDQGLESGASNVVTVTNTEGNYVSDAQVYVNGQDIGSTDERGQLSFQVPEQSSFTISASSSGQEAVETFEVEGKNVGEDEGSEDSGRDSGDTGAGSDRSGNDVSVVVEDVSVRSISGASRIEVSGSVEATDASYEVRVNGSQKAYEEFDGQVQVDRTVTSDMVGVLDVKISVLKSGEEVASDSVQTSSEGSSSGKTGIYNQTRIIPGQTAVVKLLENGELVSDQPFDVNGETIGTTDVNGEARFEVPYNHSLKIYVQGFDEKTFEVQQELSQPDLVLNSPRNDRRFEAFTDQETGIKFNATVGIAKEVGRATLRVNGTEVYSQPLSFGQNNVITTESFPKGAYSWEMEVEADGKTEVSDNLDFDVAEKEFREGLYLGGDVRNGSILNVTLYEDNQLVEGEEIFVNGESKSVTDSEGMASFQVPNVEEIEITTGSGIDTVVEQVEGYEETVEIDASFAEDLVKGQNNIVQVSAEGEPANDTPIYLDEAYAGTTGEDGNLQLEIPEKNQFTLFTQVNGTDYTQEYSPSSPSYDFEVVRPLDATDIDSSTVDFNITLQLNSEAYVNAYLINKTTGEPMEMYSEIVPTSQSSVMWTESFTNADTYEWYLELENPDNGDILSNSRTLEFETLQGSGSSESGGSGSGGG